MWEIRCPEVCAGHCDRQNESHRRLSRPQNTYSTSTSTSTTGAADCQFSCQASADEGSAEEDPWPINLASASATPACSNASKPVAGPSSDVSARALSAEQDEKFYRDCFMSASASCFHGSLTIRVISELGEEGELEQDKWKIGAATECKRKGSVLCDLKIPRPARRTVAQDQEPNR